MITGKLRGTHVSCEKTPHAVELYNRSRYGTLQKRDLRLSLYEACYLQESEKLEIRNRTVMTHEQLMRAGRRIEKDFQLKYAVYSDLRARGYIVKTALKYGADFRVYDKGVKPGDDHARWVVYPVHESRSMTWYDFAAKNRVAHSTRKRLLIAIVDEEGDVTYFEVQWVRP